jgi:predicted phage baseplate assembly protein
VELDDSGRCYIVFGDGVNGRIPPSGTNNLRAGYRVGGGAEGNIPAGTIKELVSDVDYIESVSNSSAASGGADPETLKHARKFAPASLRSLERAVSAGDYKYLAESYVSEEYGAIVKAAALEIGLSVEVRIVPASGGAPPQGLKDELRAYLVERRTACTGLEVADPIYNYVDITLDLYIRLNYSRDAVVNEVRSSLASLLSPTYQDPHSGLYPHEFGRDVYLSDLYHAIESVPGVDRCDITEPLTNVTIEDNEIADIGSLNIAAHQGGETKSYLDLEI